jgi:phosphoglycerate dehydrogenase-like enzyme
VDILLLERLVPEALSWLESRHSVEYRPELAADPAALRKAVYKAQAVVLPRKVPVTREFLDFAPRLRAVARMHVGTDNTDLEACRDRHIRVIQASTATVRSNAEYLLASLLLMYRRGIGSALIGDRHADIRIGREINGSVVGILGLAPAAHALALMLTSLGARLIGYDPAVHHTAPIWQRLGVQPVSLSDLMARSDGVSVQVMYASRYQGFINDKVLAHCKPGQLWAGISRSALFGQRGAQSRPRACVPARSRRRRRLGHKGFVGQLAVGLGDLALQARGFLAQAGFLGGHVDLHVQAQAGLAHHGHRGGLRGGGPGGLVVKHLHFVELGQRLQHGPARA